MWKYWSSIDTSDFYLSTVLESKYLDSRLNENSKVGSWKTKRMSWMTCRVPCRVQGRVAKVWDFHGTVTVSNNITINWYCAIIIILIIGHNDAQRNENRRNPSWGELKNWVIILCGFVSTSNTFPIIAIWSIFNINSLAYFTISSFWISIIQQNPGCWGTWHTLTTHPLRDPSFWGFHITVTLQNGPDKAVMDLKWSLVLSNAVEITYYSGTETKWPGSQWHHTKSLATSRAAPVAHQQKVKCASSAR